MTNDLVFYAVLLGNTALLLLYTQLRHRRMDRVLGKVPRD